MSTTWPNGDQSFGVSTTMRPVTQTAEVDVKKALRTETRAAGRGRDRQAQQDAADGDEAHDVQRQQLAGNSRGARDRYPH